jgi:hypothetical protein
MTLGYEITSTDYVSIEAAANVRFIETSVTLAATSVYFDQKEGRNDYILGMRPWNTAPSKLSELLLLP